MLFFRMPLKWGNSVQLIRQAVVGSIASIIHYMCNCASLSINNLNDKTTRQKLKKKTHQVTRGLTTELRDTSFVKRSKSIP